MGKCVCLGDIPTLGSYNPHNTDQSFLRPPHGAHNDGIAGDDSMAANTFTGCRQVINSKSRQNAPRSVPRLLQVCG